MAITWGSWSNTSGLGSGNQMRVGVDVDVSSVSNSSSSVTFTYRVYTANRYNISYNGMTLSFGGNAGSGSVSFNNQQGSGTQTLRATRTHTYSYSTYGSSPGTRTFTASVSSPGAGSVSVTNTIPARPYANPAAPSGFSASRGTTSATLSWDRNATTGRPYSSQTLQRAVSGSGAWGTVATLSGTATSYTATGLGATTDYVFRIRANNSAGSSGWATANAFSGISAPAAPSGLTGTRGYSTSAQLTWTRNATTARPYSSQTLQRAVSGSGSWSTIANLSATATSYNATGLTLQTDYVFRIRANNAAGSSGWTTSAVFLGITAPAAPTNVQAARSSDATATVTWTRNATTARPYASQSIQREVVQGTSSGWASAGSIGVMATSVSVTSGMGTNRAVRFRVRANNAAGSSSWAASDFIYTTPAPMTGVSAAFQSNGQVRVGWTNNVGYTAYTIQVQRSVAGGDWVFLSGSTGIEAGTTSWIDTSPGNGTNQYRVRAVSQVGTLTSAWVTTAMVNTTPDPPTNVRASTQANGTIRVTWTNNVGYAAYTSTIQRRVAGGAWATMQTGIASGVTTWTDPSPGTGTNQYQVRTVGLNSQISAWTLSNVVSTIAAPLAPNGLSPNGQTADLDRDVTLTWTHRDSGDGADQSQYQIQYSLTGGAPWTTLPAQSSDVSRGLFPAGTVPNGTTVQWQVRTMGIASAGWGPWSAVASFTGSTTPVVTITNPTDLQSQSPMQLTWEYDQPEGSPQTQWRAELFDGSGTLLEARAGYGAAQFANFAFPLGNMVSYRVTVQVRSGAGLWSDVASQDFIVDLLPPADVNLDASYDPDTGTAQITISALQAIPQTTMPIDHVDLQRRIAPCTDPGGNCYTDDDRPAVGDFSDWQTIVTDIRMPTGEQDVVVATNRYPDPSFEYGPGTFDGSNADRTIERVFAPEPVRTNLATRPNPTGTAGGWTSGSAAQYTVTRVNDVVRRPGTWSSRTDIVAGATLATVGYWATVGVHSSTGGITVSPGQTYVYSIWSRASIDGGRRQHRMRFFDSAGVQVGSDVLGPVDPVGTPGAAANTWTRTSWTFTPPAGTVTCRPLFVMYTNDGSNQSGSEHGWITDCQIETGTDATDYFDGDMANTADYQYSWSGTAQASPSVRTPVVTGGGGAPTGISHHGQYAIRVTTLNSSSQVSTGELVGSPTTAASQLGLHTGDVVTFSAWVNQQTQNTTGTWQTRIHLQGGSVDTTSVQVSQFGVWQQIAVTAEILDDSQALFGRIYLANAVGIVTYIDDVGFTLGSEPVDFSGDSEPEADGSIHRWQGYPGDSWSDRILVGQASLPAKTNFYPDPGHEYGLAPMDGTPTGSGAVSLEDDPAGGEIRTGSQSLRYDNNAPWQVTRRNFYPDPSHEYGVAPFTTQPPGTSNPAGTGTRALDTTRFHTGQQSLQFRNTTPAAPVVTTNVAPRPTPAATGGWTSLSGGTYTVTRVQDMVRRSGTWSAMGQRNPAAALSGTTITSLNYVGATGSSPASVVVTPGQTYTLSIYWAASVANARIRFRRIWRATTDTSVSDITETAIATSLPANTWTRHTLTETAPEGATMLQVLVLIDLPAGSVVTLDDRCWITDFQLEEGPQATDYFDGDMRPDGVNTYAWTGTAQASPSTRTTAGAQVITNLYPDPSHEYGMGLIPASNVNRTVERSTENPHTGQYSIKLVRLMETGTSAASVILTAPFNTPAALGAQVGDTITWSVWIWQETQSLLNANQARIQITGAAFTANSANVQASRYGEWQHLSVTSNPVVNAAGALNLFIYLTQDAGIPVYVDDLGVTVNTPAAADWSGDTPAEDAISYAWTGNPGNSSSTRTLLGTLAGTNLAPGKINDRWPRANIDPPTFPGDDWARFMVTTGTTANYITSPGPYATMVPVTGGQQVEVSVDFRVPDDASDAYLAPEIYQYRADGTELGTAFRIIGSIMGGPSGATGRSVTTGTIDPAATDIRVIFRIRANQSGTAVYQLGLLMDLRNMFIGTPGAVFDGDTPADIDYTYVWAGPDGQSMSQRWLRATGRSLVQTVNLGSPASFGWAVGQVITLSAWVYVPSSVTLYPVGQGITLSVTGTDLPATHADTPSARDQWVQVQVQAEIVNATGTLLARVYLPTRSGNTIWMDDFGVALGSEPVDFSGDTVAELPDTENPDAPPLDDLILPTYRWAGTPGASVSEETLPDVAATTILTGSDLSSMITNLKAGDQVTLAAWVWEASHPGLVDEQPVAMALTGTAFAEPVYASAPDPGAWVQTWATAEVVNPAGTIVPVLYGPIGSGEVEFYDDFGLSVNTGPVDFNGDLDQDWHFAYTWRDEPGQSPSLAFTQASLTTLDTAPVTCGINEFRAVVTSTAPSQAISDTVTIVARGVDDGQWLFLSWGAGFELIARARCDPSTSESAGRDRAVQPLLGHREPVLMIGVNRTRTVSASATLAWGGQFRSRGGSSPAADFRQAALEATTVLYRDYTGRRVFGMLSEMSIDDGLPGMATISFTVTEARHIETVAFVGDQPGTEEEDDEGGEEEPEEDEFTALAGRSTNVLSNETLVDGSRGAVVSSVADLDTDTGGY